MPLRIGLTATVELTVHEADTAKALRSGDVDVLGTPRVLALAEEATMAAVKGKVAKGETTVARRVQLDHVAPSPVGNTVTAVASLDKIEGRRLIFAVTVSDSRGLIAAGKVTRVVVGRSDFLARASG